MRKKVIVVLGGNLEQDKNKRWRSVGFDLTDTSLGVRDYFRVLATAILWKEDKNADIIASGGRGMLHDVLPDDITIASVMKTELVELNVNPSAIIEEGKSGSTFEQLQELSLLQECEEIVIISNEWHLPRISAMINYLEPLSNLRSDKITLLAAEDVLLHHDHDLWSPVIETARKSEILQSVIESEKRGVAAIKSGQYKFRKS